VTGAYTIRRARPDDRDALYAVCLATGRDGEDASADFEDPELLGQRFVGPYLALEPELSFTLADAEGPCGYVLGTADSERFYRRFLDIWIPPLRARLAAPTGGPAGWSPDERLRAELREPTVVLPADRAAHPAHAHIDLLPRAQGQGLGRRMMQTLLEALAAQGAVGVHLGVSPRNARAQGFYRALGFREIAAEREDSDTLLMGRSLPLTD
jgi:ribosomal protein S18 acetylase RimI-like enzyme